MRFLTILTILYKNRFNIEKSTTDYGALKATEWEAFLNCLPSPDHCLLYVESVRVNSRAKALDDVDRIDIIINKQLFLSVLFTFNLLPYIAILIFSMWFNCIVIYCTPKGRLDKH